MYAKEDIAKVCEALKILNDLPFPVTVHNSTVGHAKDIARSSVLLHDMDDFKAAFPEFTETHNDGIVFLDVISGGIRFSCNGPENNE